VEGYIPDIVFLCVAITLSSCAAFRHSQNKHKRKEVKSEGLVLQPETRGEGQKQDCRRQTFEETGAQSFPPA